MARQNLVFEALFNGSNPFPTASLYKQACCSHSVSQSKTIVREGDGSFKADARATDSSISGGYRPEFIPAKNDTKAGQLIDGWYGYSIYFQDWKACSSGCGEHVMQWHPDNGSGSAQLAIYTEKNTFHVRLNPEGDETAKTLKDGLQIIPNKWYDIVFHVIWSSDATKGLVKMWIDGVEYVSFTGATLTSGGIPYFKIGINRWNMGSTSRVLYIDNVRIGSAAATYADVSPAEEVVVSNRPPLANAGGDFNVTLPSEGLLVGAATDSDGTVASTKWTLVSGPNVPTLVAPNALSCAVKGLVVGSYVFQLTVTDNQGAIATDNVSVTVKPEPIPEPKPETLVRVNSGIVENLLVIRVEKSTDNGATWLLVETQSYKVSSTITRV